MITLHKKDLSSVLGHEGFAHPARNVNTFGVQAGMKVADFGAGSGAYAIALLKTVGKDGVVYAVDVQKDLLRRIRNDAHAQGLQHIEVIWADLEKPHASKIANHSLDMVLISNLLFQLDERAPIFEEAHRVLKKTGRLVVVDWSESYGGLGPTEDAVVTREDAQTLAVDNGFMLERAFEAGDHHYGLIFKPQASFA